jgi:hypothetical protein
MLTPAESRFFIKLAKIALQSEDAIKVYYLGSTNTFKSRVKYSLVWDSLISYKELNQPLKALTPEAKAFYILLIKEVLSW